jgi:hypothetical protein
MSAETTLGLIAGNGRFPFLLLDAARARGLRVVVAAIKEETDAEMDERARLDADVVVHWMSLGELSKLIETFQREDGGAGAAQADILEHPAGLAAGEAASESADAEYGYAAGCGGEGAGG